MARHDLLSILLAVAIGLPVATQSSGTDLGQSAPNVHEGQTVWADTADGREIKGRVLRVSAASLDLRVHGTIVTLPLPAIKTIAVRDSVKNGVKFGAWTGMTIAAVGAVYGLTDCDDGCLKAAIVGLPVIFGAGAAFGALYGLIIDVAIPGRTVVYSTNTSPATLTIAPVVSRGGLGIGGSLRW